MQGKGCVQFDDFVWFIVLVVVMYFIVFNYFVGQCVGFIKMCGLQLFIQFDFNGGFFFYGVFFILVRGLDGGSCLGMDGVYSVFLLDWNQDLLC